MADIIDLKQNLKDYYFTFGFGQKYANCYTIISAYSAIEARKKMFSVYGAKWSFQYSSAEEAGIKQFNLKYIKT